MSDPKSWRRAYQLVHQELNPAKQLELCEIARRLIHERELKLTASAGDVAEQKALEEALRELWVLEEKIRNPDIQ